MFVYMSTIYIHIYMQYVLYTMYVCTICIYIYCMYVRMYVSTCVCVCKVTNNSRPRFMLALCF